MELMTELGIIVNTVPNHASAKLHTLPGTFQCLEIYLFLSPFSFCSTIPLLLPFQASPLMKVSGLLFFRRRVTKDGWCRVHVLDGCLIVEEGKKLGDWYRFTWKIVGKIVGQFLHNFLFKLCTKNGMESVTGCDRQIFLQLHVGQWALGDNWCRKKCMTSPNQLAISLNACQLCIGRQSLADMVMMLSALCSSMCWDVWWATVATLYSSSTTLLLARDSLHTVVSASWGESPDKSRYVDLKIRNIWTTSKIWSWCSCKRI